MAVKKFGYARVSSREQNPDRQIHILRDEEGIPTCRTGRQGSDCVMNL